MDGRHALGGILSIQGGGALSPPKKGPSSKKTLVQDLLALELRWSHRELPHPDRITAHRKGAPGQAEEEPLAQELRCFPNTPQVRPHAAQPSEGPCHALNKQGGGSQQH